MPKGSQSESTQQDALQILSACYQPIDVDYAFQNSFDSIAQIKQILFRSRDVPLTHAQHCWFVDGENIELKTFVVNDDTRVAINPFGLPGRRQEQRNDNRNISYTVQWNGRIVHSYALTRDGEAPRRNMPAKHTFTVPEFPYSDEKPFGHPNSGKYHTPGHCIDHKDTPQQTNAGDRSTNQHRRNYIPEQPNSYWGKHIRNPLVGALRRSGKGIDKGGVYVQYPYYGLEPLTTNGGYDVPDGVYFSGFTFSGKVKPYTLNIRWDEDFSKFIKKYETVKSRYKKVYQDYRESPSAQPVACVYDINWSANDIDDKVGQWQQNANDFLTGTQETRDKDRAHVNNLLNAAKLELWSAENKIDLAIRYAEQGDTQLALAFIRLAQQQTEKLWGLDYQQQWVSNAQQASIVKFWSEKDCVIDFWRQAKSNNNKIKEIPEQEENCCKMCAVL